MKTYLLVALMTLAAFTSSNVLAENTISKYKGSTSVILNYPRLFPMDSPTDTYKMILDATLIESSTDRVSLKIQSSKLNSCEGFTIVALGESDGFGNYDLFANKEDFLSNNSMGTMTKSGKSMSINLRGGILKKTIGRRADICQWKMPLGLDVEFLQYI